MWAEGFLSTHMATWSCEEITLGLQFGFGNGTLLPHRAHFLLSGIHVHEAPAWIWLHRRGVLTQLRLGLETVSAFRVRINRILRHPITVSWCAPQPTQHTSQFQKWPWNTPISSAGPQPGAHLTTLQFDPPGIMLSLYIVCMCVTVWNSQSLFTYLHAQTPLLQVNFSVGLPF